MADLEFFGKGAQTTPPTISTDGISYYKSLLDNTGWCEEHPAEAEALRASVDAALAGTGQKLEPPSDGRSHAQALLDRRHGLEFANGKIALPATLVDAIDHDAQGEPSDRKAI